MTTIFNSLKLSAAEKAFYSEIIRANGEDSLVAVWAMNSIIEAHCKKGSK